ncbi:MAG TPA: hypothetical protein PLZ43_00110 [bacterium]|nr:hypothetical protein [bacterium]
MNKTHISFERIVEISSGISNVTDVERIHIDDCPICKNRIESSGYLEEGIKESVKAEPIMDLGQIESIADAVFDRYYDRSSVPARFKYYFAGAAAVAASIFLFIFISGKAQKNNQIEFFTSDKESSGKVEESVEVSENVDENDIPEGVFKIDKGTVISKGRYTLTAYTDAMIVHEYENYFSVKKGKVGFSVKSGTDFMVNLNNSVLVRVLGTVFTVSVEKSINSVEVTEGLVEVIDLEKGVSSTVSKGGRETIRRVAKTASQPVNVLSEPVAQQPEMIEKPVEHVPVVKKNNDIVLFNLNGDIDLMKAEISDLETALEYSGSPVVQLHRLFELYRINGHWGSIIHFWRTESSEINSRGNPFLKEMHFAACEASIRMFLYDNEVCRSYRSQYPDGPDPDGMEDHLKMAW